MLELQFQHQSLWMYPAFAKELLEQTGIDIHYKRSGRLQPINSEHQKENLIHNAQVACENWPSQSSLPVQELLLVFLSSYLLPVLKFRSNYQKRTSQ